MPVKQFWLGLLLVTVLAAAAAIGLAQVAVLAPHWILSLVAIILFFLLSVGVFYLGKYTARSTNRHTFTNVILGFTIVKMFLSGGGILMYALLAEPQDKLFILPFFLIYLLYTVFEVYVLIRLAQETGGEKKNKEATTN